MNGTIARLTIASLLRGWRGLLLALLPLGFLAIALLMRVVDATDQATVDGLLGGLNMATVVPLVALIIGTGSLATEIDDGSIIYLLTKPVKRSQIIITKLAVAVVIALGFTVVSTILGGLLLTGTFGEVTLGYTVAVAVSTIVYCALFIMFSVISKHAVLVGLVYILLWEGLIVGFVEGARVLSIQSWGLAIADQVTPEIFGPTINGVLGMVLAAVALVGTTWFASQRLRSLTLTSES
ncbi:ABC-2 type transport system permease protein [Stackebrandtia endophytica]|uniref:ABC-2 type transport system permease protein n=1 Tax=Stackebrandtia endophytica TaxID=1496996 RepID=A0A543AV80_9ACTN|nr:ABC transporter permease subunit [Stackebrandtia endophytica]TQL76467.1 ABC-2 type transport system permease protein [Stackebrandtia endophytica]